MKYKIGICAVVLLCFMFLFSSCEISGINIGIAGVTSYRYENSNSYSAGNTTIASSVTALDISWISGNVFIECYDGSDILVTEDSDDVLASEEMLHYCLDGTTLYIKFMKSGIYKTSYSDKQLTIKIPYTCDLSDIAIETVSADVELNDTKADDLDVETVSGNIIFSNIKTSDSTDIGSVSGKIKGILTTKELSVENVSGNIEVEVIDGHEIFLKNVSGNALISGNCTPKELEIETISGEAEIRIPKNSEFSVKFNGVSGEFESDFPMTFKGKTYICGNAENEYEVDTVSGDVRFSFYENSVK